MCFRPQAEIRPERLVVTAALIGTHLFFAQLRLFEYESVSHIVLIYVADIAYSFLTDLPRGHELDISKPFVRIQSFTCCLLAQTCDSIGTSVIGGKGEQSFVEGIKLIGR